MLDLESKWIHLWKEVVWISDQCFGQVVQVKWLSLVIIPSVHNIKVLRENIIPVFVMNDVRLYDGRNPGNSDQFFASAVFFPCSFSWYLSAFYHYINLKNYIGQTSHLSIKGDKDQTDCLTAAILWIVTETRWLTKTGDKVHLLSQFQWISFFRIPL